MHGLHLQRSTKTFLQSVLSELVRYKSRLQNCNCTLSIVTVSGSDNVRLDFWNCRLIGISWNFSSHVSRKPFPADPAELIMPLAGFRAAQGKEGLESVLIAGTLGSFAGTAFWYLIGRWLGRARIRLLIARSGRWLAMSPKDFDQAERFFSRHAEKSVFIGRVVPGLRSLISIPAGIIEMPLLKFTAYSLVGTFIWTTALGLAGYFLGTQIDGIAWLINLSSNIFFGILVLIYLYRVTFPGSNEITNTPTGAQP